MNKKNANGKRKCAGETAATCQRIVSPIPIKCEAARPSAVPSRAESRTVLAEASYGSLPQEVFCNMVGYLGPTSSTLCALGQVNRNHRGMMRSIGDVMLQRARMRFRVPLPPRSPHESSISLFVRHARASKTVHDRLEVLDRVLSKDFPVVDAPTFAMFPSELLKSRAARSDGVSVEPAEVDHALNIALCLLGCWKEHYFEDLNEARNIAVSAASTALDWRVSNLCSELGSRAYKYAKSRMCRRYEQEDSLFFASTSAYDEELRHEEYSDYDSDGDMSVDSCDFGDDADMILLDKASLVMQLVLGQQRTTLNAHTAAVVVNQVRNMLS